jgi:hypothetical protein
VCHEGGTYGTLGYALRLHRRRRLRRQRALTTGRLVQSAPFVSDYTFERIYYRSVRERERDYLPVRDYIWRWDTDWFWCSKNVGAQVPWIRRLYGRRRLGSRTYQRIMRWNSHWGLTAALHRLRGGYSESVIQDVDIPVANAPAFLDWFHREIGISPVWMCPLRGTDAADSFPSDESSGSNRAGWVRRQHDRSGSP